MLGFLGQRDGRRYRIRVGWRIGSAVLVADGLRARTDGFTSLAVLGGPAGVAAGFPLADPIVGLLITVAILAVLRTTVRDVYRRLMDVIDLQLVDQAERTLLATRGVLDVRAIRMRWLGHRLPAEADLDIDGRMDVNGAHQLAHDAEHRLNGALPKLRTAAMHAYPTLGGH